MSACLFCKIIKGEIPCSKVHEDSEFLAFHDINPKAPIHILVIPKAHIEKFQDASGELMARMTPFIQECASKLGLDKDGYRLITNNGHDGGQEVYHLHFHLLGGTRLKWVDLRESADEAKKNL